jgi:hypothetical protein
MPVFAQAGLPDQGIGFFPVGGITAEPAAEHNIAGYIEPWHQIIILLHQGDATRQGQAVAGCDTPFIMHMIIKSGQQTQDGCFANAGRAQQTGPFSRRNDNLDMVKDQHILN